MHNKLKIVKETPLTSRWKGSENLVLYRKNYLKKEEIKILITAGPVQFIIADIGKELVWVEIKDCYNFWKSEVIEHIPENNNQIILENFLGDYAYLASEWVGEIVDTVILLEKIH